MVEFAGFGSDDTGVRLKAEFALKLRGCIAGTNSFAKTKKSISVKVKAQFHDARPKGHASTVLESSLRRIDDEGR